MVEPAARDPSAPVGGLGQRRVATDPIARQGPLEELGRRAARDPTFHPPKIVVVRGRRENICEHVG